MMLPNRFWTILALSLSIAWCTGCQTTPFNGTASSRQKQNQNSFASSKRALLIAQKFEQQGRTKNALSLYRQIKLGSPQSKFAQQRITALTSPATLPKNIADKTILAQAVRQKSQSTTTLPKAIFANKSSSSIQTLNTVASSQEDEITSQISDSMVSSLATSRTPSPIKLLRVKAVKNKRHLKRSTRRSTPASQQKLAARSTKTPSKKSVQHRFPVATYKSAETDKTASPEKNQTVNLPTINPQGKNPLLSSKNPLLSSKNPVKIIQEPGKFPVAVSVVESMDAPASSPKDIPPSPYEKFKFPTIKETVKTPKSIVFTEPVPELEESRWTKTKRNGSSENSFRLTDQSLLALCPKADKKIKALIYRLDEESELQKESLASLANMGESASSALPALNALLSSDDQTIHAHTIWAISKIEGQSLDTVQRLARLLNSKNSDVIEASTYFLGRMGNSASSAVPQLNALLENGNSRIRLHASEAIIKIIPNDLRATKTLISILSRGDDEVRWLAAYAVGELSPSKHPEVIEALTQSLIDADPRVREASALTLGGFGVAGRPALSELVRVVHSKSLVAQPEVKYAVELALKCIESESADQNEKTSKANPQKKKTHSQE